MASWFSWEKYPFSLNMKPTFVVEYALIMKYCYYRKQNKNIGYLIELSLLFPVRSHIGEKKR